MLALYARNFINKFYNPDVIYGDITLRERDRVPGHLDLYASGFPCQPYSLAGKMNGFNDVRSEPAHECLCYILEKLPRSFFLENVAALVEHFTDDFNALITFLRDIKDPVNLAGNGGPYYEVHWMIVDSVTHSGLPQSRRRVYVVGLAKHSMKKPFEPPGPITCKPLQDILSDRCGCPQDVCMLSNTKRKNVHTLYAKYANKNHSIHDYIADIGASSVSATDQVCPCLTASRTGDMGYWSLRRRRQLDMHELMALQGVSAATFPSWDQVVSQRQMGNIIGNAMTVSYVRRLVAQMLDCMGYPVNKMA